MDALLERLDKCQCRFEIIEHKQPILTREEGVHILISKSAKQQQRSFLKSEQGFFGADLGRELGAIGFSQISPYFRRSEGKVSLSKEVQKVTGFEIGSVHIVGLNILHVIDQQLFTYNFVYGASGRARDLLLSFYLNQKRQT